MFENIDPIVFCIPFIAAFIGWLTNMIAVKATLYPVKFIGIPPIFGWQGVIPKNAEEMSQNFSTMIRDKLIDTEAMFASIKHDKEQTDKLIDKMTDKVIEEFATNIAPESWAKARDKLRQYITNLIRQNISNVIDSMFDKLKADADQLIDIDAIMAEEMTKDRGLMGKVLFEVASPEFKFIEISGLYFGFLFGIVQMFIWMLYPASWVLPVAGFLVGYATNWMALTLIFEPSEPVKVGPFTIQGLFVKRQFEAAAQFANVVCDEVLNSANITKQMASGNSRVRLVSIMEEQINESMAIYEEDPMVAMLAGADKLSEAKTDILERLHTIDFNNSDFSKSDLGKDFTGNTDMIRTQILDNLRDLAPGEFNEVLRPTFKKDEWKLWLAGGVIGTAIGALQFIYLFGGSF